jgi:hypothetical protein
MMSFPLVVLHKILHGNKPDNVCVCVCVCVYIYIYNKIKEIICLPIYLVVLGFELKALY